MDLNCMGPLTIGYFLINSTTVLHDPQLGGFSDVESPISRDGYNLCIHTDFRQPGGLAPLTPALLKDQL